MISCIAGALQTFSVTAHQLHLVKNLKITTGI